MKNKKTVTTVGTIILILFPVIFLLYKISGNSKDVSTNPTNPAIDIAAMEAAAASNPNYNNLVNLSNAYLNSNMPTKSLAPLNRAIELNPKSAIAYNNLGFAYTMMQEYKSGIEACSTAVSIDSSFQLAKNNLKWATDENNKILLAIAEAEKIPEAKRDIPYYINYGLLHLKEKNYDTSIEIWNKILEIEPKNSIALNNIGTAYMMKLQFDEAIIRFKKAVEVDANDQLAKNNLAWALNEKQSHTPQTNKVDNKN